MPYSSVIDLGMPSEVPSLFLMGVPGMNRNHSRTIGSILPLRPIGIQEKYIGRGSYIEGRRSRLYITRAGIDHFRGIYRSRGTSIQARRVKGKSCWDGSEMHYFG